MSTGLKTHRITDPNDDTRFVDVDPYVVEGIVRTSVDGQAGSIQYSMNISSSTDNGTGDNTYTLTNDAIDGNQPTATTVVVGDGSYFCTRGTADPGSVVVDVWRDDGARVDGNPNFMMAGQLA